jgi:type II secretory pathway component PulM
MNTRLPWLHDVVEPAARTIAERAATLQPADAQRAYLADVAREIVRSERLST